MKLSLSQDLGQRLFHVRDLVPPYTNLPDCVELFPCPPISKIPETLSPVYQFWKGISAGPALKYFTWFIGADSLGFSWKVANSKGGTFTWVQAMGSRWKTPKNWELKCTFECIKLPAKLLDYFLPSNKNNINQWTLLHNNPTYVSKRHMDSSTQEACVYTHKIMLQCGARRCVAVWCNAVCCSVLQCPNLMMVCVFVCVCVYLCVCVLQRLPPHTYWIYLHRQFS